MFAAVAETALAKRLGATAVAEDPDGAAARSKRAVALLDAPPKGVDRYAVIKLAPKSGARVEGKKVWDAVYSAGF